jgi:hypothetical protein
MPCGVRGSRRASAEASKLTGVCHVGGKTVGVSTGLRGSGIVSSASALTTEFGGLGMSEATKMIGEQPELDNNCACNCVQYLGLSRFVL